jgi:electron transfer flavoprotein alpha subunit
VSVLVVLEHRGGKWNRQSWEALAAGAALASLLGTACEAVVLGANALQLAKEVRGAAKTFAIEHPLLAEYKPDAYTLAMEQLIKAVQPLAVVFPHTYQVRDYAPKLATRFGRPLISDVIDIRQENGGITFVRQLFQGKLNANVTATGHPIFLSVQAGSFRADSGAAGTSTVEPCAVEIDSTQVRSKPEPPYREARQSVDLSASQIIVSVGRGIKEKENIGMVEDLASALGADLAASRPICDNGWLPMERQVGSSGQTVSPALYVAVGISGAIQHLVGMKGSKTVVAINQDEGAPIFEIADYGIVGDLFEIVPALAEEIRKAKT